MNFKLILAMLTAALVQGHINTKGTTMLDEFQSMIYGGCQGGNGEAYEEEGECSGGADDDSGAGQCSGSDDESGAGQCSGSDDESGAGQCSGSDDESGAGQCSGSDDESGAGQCSGIEDEGGAGQCSGTTDENGAGQCSGSTDDEDEGDYTQQEGTMLLAGMMGSMYRKFENSSDVERKKEFSKIIPMMDLNSDKSVTFDELYGWVLKEIEEDAYKIDIGISELMTMDKDKDDKISWDEFEAEHKKISVGQTTDENTLAHTLKKERLRFTYVDHNSDGFITNDELPRLVLPENFEDMNEMAVKLYFLDYDTNGDGEISKEELQVGAKSDFTVTNPSEHFQRHDKNKDGRLTVDEIRDHALDTLGTPHVLKEVQIITHLLDINNDEVLSYEELENGFSYFTDYKKTLPKEEVKIVTKDEL